MQRLGPALAISALAVLVSTPSAFAAVSAADVWAQWQDYAARSGQTVTAASQAASGDTLTLTGVTFANTQAGNEVRLTLDQVVMHENGDGSVSIQLPAASPLEITTTAEDETVTIGLSVGHEGLELTAHGTPEALAYDYSASRISVDLDRLETSGEEKPEVTARLVAEGVEGSYRFGSAEPQPVEAAMRADRLTFSLDAKAEENQTALTMNGQVSELVATSTSVLPSGLAGQDPAAMLRAGMAVSGTFNYGPADFQLQASSTDGDLNVTSKVAAGTLGMQLSKAGLRWSSGSQGLSVDATGSVLPLPQIALSLAESGFGLTMPLEKSEVPQDVGLLVRLSKLDLDDGLWSLLDPLGQLVHDPLTLVVDLGGKATPLVDVFSEDMESDLAALDQPALLHSLDLNELELTAAGASVTGAGAFTFDNDDLQTFDGIPAPEGSLDVKIVGATQLIDTLTAMGLVPEDQSMMAKMMLGMFTKPTGEPDTVTSTIEVKRSGQVFANGAQLR